jgi:Na+-driven multidrug efflux pump
MISSSLFQGMKKGGRSLTVTILRTIILQIPFTWILGIYFQFGLIGVWSGIVAGNFIAVMIAFIWARKSLSNIKWQVL